MASNMLWLLFTSPALLDAPDHQRLSAFVNAATANNARQLAILGHREHDNLPRYHFVLGPAPDGLDDSTKATWVTNLVRQVCAAKSGNIRKWGAPHFDTVMKQAQFNAGNFKMTLVFSNFSHQALSELPRGQEAQAATHLTSASVMPPSPAMSTHPSPATFKAINHQSRGVTADAIAPFSPQNLAASNSFAVPSMPASAMRPVVKQEPLEIDDINTSPGYANADDDDDPFDDHAEANEDSEDSEVDDAHDEDDNMQDNSMSGSATPHLDAEFQPKPKRTRAKKVRVFVSKPALPDSQVVRRSMEEFFNLSQGPYLDTSPDYQRDVVWTNAQMSALVNSIIENYYIPPVLLNKVALDFEDGRVRTKRVCIDGKQRLSSVIAFMSGHIPCHDENGRDWYYCQAEDRKIPRPRILGDDQKREFREKEFICFEFDKLDTIQEEDLFARVQKGVPLTPAERMRAANGPWQSLAKKFEEDCREVINLCGNKRSAGFRYILTSFAQIMEVQHPSTASGKPLMRLTASQIGTFVKSNVELDAATEAHFRKVFRVFKDLVSQYPETFQNNGYRHAKSFAPVELVIVACLLSMYCDSRNLFLLAGDIRLMRELLRKNFTDLRMNPPTWAAAWEYLDQLEQFRGTVNGSTVPKRDATPLPAPKKRKTRTRETFKEVETPERVKERAKEQPVGNKADIPSSQQANELRSTTTPVHPRVSRVSSSARPISTTPPVSLPGQPAASPDSRTKAAPLTLTTPRNDLAESRATLSSKAPADAASASLNGPNHLNGPHSSKPNVHSKKVSPQSSGLATTASTVKPSSLPLRSPSRTQATAKPAQTSPKTGGGPTYMRLDSPDPPSSLFSANSLAIPAANQTPSFNSSQECSAPPAPMLSISNTPSRNLAPTLNASQGVRAPPAPISSIPSSTASLSHDRRGTSGNPIVMDDDDDEDPEAASRLLSQFRGAPRGSTTAEDATRVKTEPGVQSPLKRKASDEPREDDTRDYWGNMLDPWNGDGNNEGDARIDWLT